MALSAHHAVADDGSTVLAPRPSASYSITVRARLLQRPGAFARVARAIGETGAILGAIDLVRVEGPLSNRDDLSMAYTPGVAHISAEISGVARRPHSEH